MNTDERRKEYHHDGRAGQYLPADGYRRNRHDRVGNLRAVRGCESAQGIAGKDYARAKRENDGIRVGCFGWKKKTPMDGVTVGLSTSRSVGWLVGQLVIRSYERERFNFSTAGKAEQSFPFTKAKQARGFTSAARSSGYAVSR